MGLSMLCFATVVAVFLGIVIFAFMRIQVMSKIDDYDESTGYLLNPESQGSTGVAQTSSYTVDGEQ